MKAVEFPEQDLVGGENQDKYPKTPLKLVFDSEFIPVYSKWKPSDEDLKRLNEGGYVWLKQITRGQPLQRAELLTEAPDFVKLDKEAKTNTDKIIQHVNEGMKHKRNDKTKSIDFKKMRNKLKGGKE